MRRTALIVLGTVAAVAAAMSRVVMGNAAAAEPQGPAKNVVTGSLRSEVLGEERGFIVHLPESYEKGSARRYPTLYVLDGGEQGQHTADTAARLARGGEMPEVLVVGIPNLSDATWRRDYTPPGIHQTNGAPGDATGQGDRFLKFLETELIPRIERDFPAGGGRMLAGWSRGGLLVVYSLIAAPSLFDARFVYSPAAWRDDGAIIARLETFLASSPKELRGSLYLSAGDQEVERLASAFDRLVAMLKAKAPPTLRWRADVTRGANHGTNPVLATPVGLRFHFGGKGGNGSPPP